MARENENGETENARTLNMDAQQRFLAKRKDEYWCLASNGVTPQGTHVMLPPEGKVCNFCGNPANLRCSGCMIIFYCDEKCQKEAWKAHKPQCDSKKTYVVEDDNNRCRRCLARATAKKTSNGSSIRIARGVYERIIASPTWDEFKASPLPIGGNLASVLGYRNYLYLKWKRGCDCRK